MGRTTSIWTIGDTQISVANRFASLRIRSHTSASSSPLSNARKQVASQYRLILGLRETIHLVFSYKSRPFIDVDWVVRKNTMHVLGLRKRPNTQRPDLVNSHRRWLSLNVEPDFAAHRHSFTKVLHSEVEHFSAAVALRPAISYGVINAERYRAMNGHGFKGALQRTHSDGREADQLVHMCSKAFRDGYAPNHGAVALAEDRQASGAVLRCADERLRRPKRGITEVRRTHRSALHQGKPIEGRRDYAAAQVVEDAWSDREIGAADTQVLDLPI